MEMDAIRRFALPGDTRIGRANVDGVDVPSDRASKGGGTSLEGRDLPGVEELAG